MNNSNSFNICPRCGTANGLNAKYCYQCGSQLKIPEEPVVCHKCHTVNSSMANFCRTCGTTLKIGAQTKICPKCGREVSIDDNVCSCGYSFATIRYANPAEQAAPVIGRAADKKKKKAVPVQQKGGRLVAVFAFIFLLLFGYVVIAPIGIMPEFMRSFGVLTAEAGPLSGYDLIMQLVSSFMSMQFNYDIMMYIVLSLVVIFAISVVGHFISVIVRLFRGKKDKKANLLYLILAIITTIAVGLLVIGQYVQADWAAMFRSATVQINFWIYVIPGYFWFFYIFSLFAKAPKLKELKL